MSEAASALVEQPQPFATHGMLIFLDTSEKTIDKPGNIVVSSALFVALHQKPAPIIATTHSMKLIVETPTLTELAESSEDFHSELMAVAGFIKEGLAIPDKDLRNIKSYLEHHRGSVIKERLNFNIHDWVIKELSPHLLLLIPRDYIENMQKKYPHQSQASFSSTELSLGLKINALVSIESFTDYIKAYQPLTDPIQYQTVVAENFTHAVQKIFITNAEYAKVYERAAAKPQLPTWMFFLMGHGKVGEIVGLSIKQFKMFVDFLEKISTKLLAYVSCFGGGQNIEAVYKEAQNTLLKSYPFAILVSGIADTTVNSPIAYGQIIKNGFITYDFGKFFSVASHADTVNFAELFSYVYPESQEIDIYNTAQLKLPGMPWFNVIDQKRKIASIGNVLTEIRNIPLNVTEFFNIKEPLALLLRPNYVPFPLIISTSYMPVLIATNPEKVIFIDRLEVPNITFEQFLASFDQLQKEYGTYTYIFGKLNLKNKEEYENLVLVIRDKNRYVLTLPKEYPAARYNPSSLLGWEGVNNKAVVDLQKILKQHAGSARVQEVLRAATMLPSKKEIESEESLQLPPLIQGVTRY